MNNMDEIIKMLENIKKLGEDMAFIVKEINEEVKEGLNEEVKEEVNEPNKSWQQRNKEECPGHYGRL